MRENFPRSIISGKICKIKRHKLKNDPNDVSEEGLINIKCMIIIHLLSALFIPALLHETASLESIPLNQDVSYTGVSDPL